MQLPGLRENMFKDYRILSLLIILIVGIAIPVSAEPLSQAEAEDQARDFLLFLDQGQQDQAWFAMAPTFQALNDQAHWQSRQQVIRATYGSLAFRELRGVRYRQTLNLSPDGDYVLVQFQSSYQHKAETVETVVLDCRVGPKCSVRQYIIQ